MQICSGASSGLHHDFHDNLYILLRGRKRFRLYPPEQAKRMYTHGRIAKVHANGRIVYTDQACRIAPLTCKDSCMVCAANMASVHCLRPLKHMQAAQALRSARRPQDETNADGSGADETAAWQERIAAEADIAAAQEAVQRSEKARDHGVSCGKAKYVQACCERGVSTSVHRAPHSRMNSGNMPGRMQRKKRCWGCLQGAAARLTAAEARLDAALERALDLQLGAGDDDGDDDSVDGGCAARREDSCLQAPGPSIALLQRPCVLCQSDGNV